jgi:hypothetical protein
MPERTNLEDLKLNEVQRIMRKQLAAWCNPEKLKPEEIAAVNEIIVSSAAARYPNVAAVLNATDLGTALEGNTISGEPSERLFSVSVIQSCYKKGIKLKLTGWPSPLKKETIETLSQKVMP